MRDPIAIRLPTNHSISGATVYKSINLESKCINCNAEEYAGHGHPVVSSKCDYCNGSGVVINEIGEAILQLVSIYLKAEHSKVLLARAPKIQSI